jgi:hypothetical protein
MTKKITNTLTFYIKTTKSYEFTFADFCVMDAVITLTEEQKIDAWKKLVKTSVRGEIEVNNGWNEGEQAEWDEVEEGVVDAINESVEEVVESTKNR